MDILKKRVLITGGSGFIGRPLVFKLLMDGYLVSVMTRSPEYTSKLFANLVTVYYDFDELPQSQYFDIVINLAGENIKDGRWTDEKKQLLWHSRIDLTQKLVAYCLEFPPERFIQASALGYYGLRKEGPWPLYDESAPKGEGFLADLCAAWEEATTPLRAKLVAVAITRFAIVLDQNSGAWPDILRPYQYHVGGPIGDGGHPFSWIHRDDVVSALLWLIKKEKSSHKIYNFVAPEESTQKEISDQIREALACSGPSMKTPKWLVETLLGERANLATGGQRVMPKALLDEGYVFQVPTFAIALEKLLSENLLEV